MSNAHKTFTKDGFVITTDPSRFDIDGIHKFLTHSYWAEGVPKEIVERSVRFSLCFGLFRGKEQIGFARVITDRARFAYLADVYVVEPHRGKGLGSWLMSCIMAHPDLQNLRLWSLLTRDAHGLYRKFGFTDPMYPERYMELRNPDAYKRKHIESDHP